MMTKKLKKNELKKSHGGGVCGYNDDGNVWTEHTNDTSAQKNYLSSKKKVKHG